MLLLTCGSKVLRFQRIMVAFGFHPLGAIAGGSLLLLLSNLHDEAAAVPGLHNVLDTLAPSIFGSHGGISVGDIISLVIFGCHVSLSFDMDGHSLRWHRVSLVEIGKPMICIFSRP